MAVSWGNIRSLVIFFGPILLPKAIAYYKSLRAARRRANLPIVDPPPGVLRALAFLGTLTVALLVLSTPYFAPENVFSLTQSRLQIPVDVLFTRLASLRPDQALTPRDESLRARFVNSESRLLYFQYGPEVLADCPFCRSDEPSTYFYYALPALLAPHVLNLLAIAAATSFPVSGRHGASWRNTATVAVAALACLDAYLLSAYNPRANARALRLGEVDPFHWNLRAGRLVALAGLDAALAFLMFLSSTNRAFVGDAISPAARLEAANKMLGTARSKMAALGIVRNASVRDETLRDRTTSYWAHEVRLMGQVMEEREVVEGVNDAVGSGRLDVEKIERDAEGYAAGVMLPHLKNRSEDEGSAPVTMVG